MLENSNTHHDSQQDVDLLLSPLLDCKVSLKEIGLIINEMYAASVISAPADETDNFTAKRNTPVFLALIEFVENLKDYTSR